MNTESHVLYFSAAEDLRDFANFTVEETSQARPGRIPATVSMYMIVGQRGGLGRREVLAEFPLELHANIFRDMCDGFVRCERAPQ